MSPLAQPENPLQLEEKKTQKSIKAGLQMLRIMICINMSFTYTYVCMSKLPVTQATQMEVGVDNAKAICSGKMEGTLLTSLG